MRKGAFDMRKLESNPAFKMVGAIFGGFLYAFGINMFITGLGLYSDGVMGVSQLLRTFTEYLFGTPPFDLAGIYYYIINIPLFIMAYKTIGRRFILRTFICVTMISLFASFIPVPKTPLLDDKLLCCLIGGYISGFGTGLTLKMGSSSGGTNIIGLYCIKKDLPFSVGGIALMINITLYVVCMIVFNVETALYSMVFAFVSSIALDRTYSQSINVQAIIITKEKSHDIDNAIITKLVRGVTAWNGSGSYTGTDARILCVVLSKYEVASLKALVHDIDPGAFIIVNEGIKVDGNYLKKLY